METVTVAMVAGFVAMETGAFFTKGPSSDHVARDPPDRLGDLLWMVQNPQFSILLTWSGIPASPLHSTSHGAR